MKHAIVGMILAVSVAAVALGSWAGTAAALALCVALALVLWDERSQRAAGTTEARLAVLDARSEASEKRLHEALAKMDAALAKQQEEFLQLGNAVRSIGVSRR